MSPNPNLKKDVEYEHPQSNTNLLTERKALNSTQIDKLKYEYVLDKNDDPNPQRGQVTWVFPMKY